MSKRTELNRTKLNGVCLQSNITALHNNIGQTKFTHKRTIGWQKQSKKIADIRERETTHSTHITKMSSSQLNEYKICTYGEMKRLRFVHFLFFSSVALLLTTNIFIKYFYKTHAHAHALSMPVYGRWQHDYQTISSMIDAYHHNWNPQMSAESRQAKTKHMALFNFKTDAVYECISPPLSLSGPSLFFLFILNTSVK